MLDFHTLQLLQVAFIIQNTITNERYDYIFNNNNVGFTAHNKDVFNQQYPHINVAIPVFHSSVDLL